MGLQIDARLAIDAHERVADVGQCVGNVELGLLVVVLVEGFARAQRNGARCLLGGLEGQSSQTAGGDLRNVNPFAGIDDDLDSDRVLFDADHARRAHFGFVEAASTEQALDAFEILGERALVEALVFVDAREHPQEQR